jgi:hypothetical protein
MYRMGSTGGGLKRLRSYENAAIVQPNTYNGTSNCDDEKALGLPITRLVCAIVSIQLNDQPQWLDRSGNEPRVKEIKPGRR